jgi:hypothetical protein
MKQYLLKEMVLKLDFTKGEFQIGWVWILIFILSQL